MNASLARNHMATKTKKTKAESAAADDQGGWVLNPEARTLLKRCLAASRSGDNTTAISLIRELAEKVPQPGGNEEEETE